MDWLEQDLDRQRNKHLKKKIYRRNCRAGLFGMHWEESVNCLAGEGTE